VAEPGSGLAAVRVVLLVRAAGQLGTLEDMEVLAVEESRRIGRESLQLALDNQAFGEVRLAGVTGSDGVRRTRLEDSSTSLLTVLGDVRVRRVAYRSGGKGGARAAPAGRGAEPAAGRVLLAGEEAGGDDVPARDV
jgi:hypothetical protein